MHDWVRETAFGQWFLRTDTWRNYVLSPAINELHELGGARVPSGSRWLDIGCGNGTSFSLLERVFAPGQIVAVDVDPDAVATARRAAVECECPITVTQGSISQLELADNSMDAVLCHQLIHHVACQAQALSELFRVLRPGGALFLSESCESFIETWTVRWFFRHPPGVQKPASGYLDLIKNAGFHVDPRHVRTSSPWWSLPDIGVTRQLGLTKDPVEPTEILVVATKPA